MNTTHTDKHIFWPLLCILALTMFLPGLARWSSTAPPYTDLPPLAEPEESTTKMESVLYRLSRIYLEQGMEEAQRFAQQRDIEMQGDRLRVITETKAFSGIFDVDSMSRMVSYQIEEWGGQVEAVWNHLIQSVIPVEALHNLAEYPTIHYIRLPLKAFPCHTSEGVAQTGANQWHDLPSYRQDLQAEVCVLDAGFRGYKALLDTELPSSVEIRSFRTDGDFNPSPHGTACAEIVHDMAPGAKLWLVNFNTEVEHHQAVDWIIDQGVKIISYSMGWFNTGAGDGTGTICADVKKATDSGIVWISASGNFAQDYWEGAFRDTDGDNWHNFATGDEILSFPVNAHSSVRVFINWDDWGVWNGSRYSGSNQDFDLYLFHWNGSSWTQTATSTNRQTGTQHPTESITVSSSGQAATWGIAIRKFKASQNVKFRLLIPNHSGPIQYNRPHGSIASPADSPHAVAVGATSWQNDSYHSYSSRGPTADSRIKPDLVAPSGVSGKTYGEKGFFGTSASTPHVAGAFALLRAKTPFPLEHIQTIVFQRALDLGPAGKDVRFGTGRLRLDR